MKILFFSIVAVFCLVAVSNAAWVDFYLISGSSNTNSGSTTDALAPVVTTNGNWGGSGTLGRFTAASGTPFSAVTTGSMASVYLDAAASAVFVSSVIAINGGGASIDVDTTTIKWGTAPSTGTTGRSCKIGGAWADLAVVTSLFPSGTAPLSTRINIKAATYGNAATSRTFGMSGTTTHPIWWRGYKTNPGDEDNNHNPVGGTDVPLITFTSGSASLTGAQPVVSSLIFNGSANAGALVTLTGAGGLLFRDQFTTTSSNAAATALTIGGNTPSVIACSMSAPATANIVVSNTGGTPDLLFGDTISGGIIGLKFAGADGGYVDFSVFDSQQGDGIQFGTGLGLIRNCSFNSQQGNGINWTGTPGGLCLVANNYFENLNQPATAAINNGSGTDTNLIRVVGSTYSNCTKNVNGITENLLLFDNGSIATAGFVNAAAKNFAINNILQGIAFPGKFEGTSVYQGYLDAGAVQAQQKTFQGVYVQ